MLYSSQARVEVYYTASSCLGFLDVKKQQW